MQLKKKVKGRVPKRKKGVSCNRVKAVIGLGNPGRKYRLTRHNLGYRVVEEFFRQEKLRWSKKIIRSCWVSVWQDEVVLALPQTYMNRSGGAAFEIKEYFDVPVDSMLVVMDEIDFSFGAIRFKASGGSAGHKGLESITGSLGTGDFNRLRIGIGPLPEDEELTSYVLSNFSSAEENRLIQVIKKSKDAIKVWIKDDIEFCMNRFNIRET